MTAIRIWLAIWSSQLPRLRPRDADPVLGVAGTGRARRLRAGWRLRRVFQRGPQIVVFIAPTRYVPSRARLRRCARATAAAGSLPRRSVSRLVASALGKSSARTRAAASRSCAAITRNSMSPARITVHGASFAGRCTARVRRAGECIERLRVHAHILDLGVRNREPPGHADDARYSASCRRRTPAPAFRPPSEWKKRSRQKGKTRRKSVTPPRRSRRRRHGRRQRELAMPARRIFTRAASPVAVVVRSGPCPKPACPILPAAFRTRGATRSSESSRMIRRLVLAHVQRESDTGREAGRGSASTSRAAGGRRSAPSLCPGSDVSRPERGGRRK